MWSKLLFMLNVRLECSAELIVCGEVELDSLCSLSLLNQQFRQPGMVKWNGKVVIEFCASFTSGQWQRRRGSAQ